MKLWASLLIIILVFVIGYFAVFGIPYFDSETSVISGVNLVGGENVSVIQKKVNFNKYYVWYSRSIVRDETIQHYLKYNEELREMQFIPKNAFLIYGKYHTKLKSWIFVTFDYDDNSSLEDKFSNYNIYKYSESSISMTPLKVLNQFKTNIHENEPFGASLEIKEDRLLYYEEIDGQVVIKSIELIKN